jgi:hypothetical protein
VIAHDGRIATLRSDTDRQHRVAMDEVGGVRARVGVVEQRFEGEIAAVREHVDSVQQQSIRVYAFGLPAVMIGVVLTNVPDRWVAQPWVTWPLVIVGLLGVVYGVFRVRSGQASTI